VPVFIPKSMFLFMFREQIIKTNMDNVNILAHARVHVLDDVRGDRKVKITQGHKHELEHKYEHEHISASASTFMSMSVSVSMSEFCHPYAHLLPVLGGYCDTFTEPDLIPTAAENLCLLSVRRRPKSAMFLYPV
jgi:hypothetical protein